MGMFRALIGDLFASQAQTLVNTVNCVGVMGKGVALEFKKRFPEMLFASHSVIVVRIRAKFSMALKPTKKNKKALWEELGLKM